jgi:hypothetical protein
MAWKGCWSKGKGEGRDRSDPNAETSSSLFLFPSTLPPKVGSMMMGWEKGGGEGTFQEVMASRKRSSSAWLAPSQAGSEEAPKGASPNDPLELSGGDGLLEEKEEEVSTSMERSGQASSSSSEKEKGARPSTAESLVDCCAVGEEGSTSLAPSRTVKSVRMSMAEWESMGACRHRKKVGLVDEKAEKGDEREGGRGEEKGLTSKRSSKSLEEGSSHPGTKECLRGEGDLGLYTLHFTREEGAVSKGGARGGVRGREEGQLRPGTHVKRARMAKAGMASSLCCMM